MSALAQETFSVFDRLDEESQTTVLRFVKFLAEESDPFYSPENWQRMIRAAKDMDEGKWVVHELLEDKD